LALTLGSLWMFATKRMRQRKLENEQNLVHELAASEFELSNNLKHWAALFDSATSKRSWFELMLLWLKIWSLCCTHVNELMLLWLTSNVVPIIVLASEHTYRHRKHQERDKRATHETDAQILQARLVIDLTLAVQFCCSTNSQHRVLCCCDKIAFTPDEAWSTLS